MASNAPAKTARIALLLAVGLLTGCADTAVRLFPVAPQAESQLYETPAFRNYDLDHDGTDDYREIFGDDSRVAAIAYRNSPGDGPNAWETVHLDEAARADDARDLIIILDSIPCRMVAQAWAAGRFRLFHPPSRTIPPFPVMTDPSLAEFFHATPCPAIEAEYFDGRRLRNGYEHHLENPNTPWHPFVDYRMPTVAQIPIYTTPGPWFDNELLDIEDRILEPGRRRLVAYMVTTSSLGAWDGRDGHQVALVRLDRMCQYIVHALRGRVRITLMSDHGHDLLESRPIPLKEMLERFGYHVGTTLKHPGDVVVPTFAVVSMAAIHTHEPAAVARDTIGIEGVELAIYRDGDGVTVLSRDGSARLTKRGDAYCYVASGKDPLLLETARQSLAASGKLGADGFASDADWFAVTADHVYPDPLRRIWNAFNGLFEHSPDVLLSLEDGYHYGSPFMTKYLDGLSAAHGSLRRSCSYGFVMSTVGGLPPVLRMGELRDALRATGVDVPTEPIKCEDEKMRK